MFDWVKHPLMVLMADICLVNRNIERVQLSFSPAELRQGLSPEPGSHFPSLHPTIPILGTRPLNCYKVPPSGECKYHSL